MKDTEHTDQPQHSSGADFAGRVGINQQYEAARFDENALLYLNGLYGYAMALTRNEAEAEDLVQETYLRALRSFDQFRPGSNLKSWLFTILRNVRLNQVRHSHSKIRVEINEPVVDVGEFEDKSSKDPFGSHFDESKASGFAESYR